MTRPVADRNEETEEDDKAGAGKPEAESLPDASEAEGIAAAPQELAPEGAPGPLAARKKARSKSKEALEGGTGEIRDRNRRIREEAAAKRRTRQEVGDARRVATARSLDATEIVDDALARSSHAVVTWLKRNFKYLQWAILLLIVGGLAYQVYSFRHRRAVARASEELSHAFSAELARVGTEGAPPADEYTGLGDPRRAFASDEQRLKAAEKEYREAEAASSGPLSALATLGLAGVLFDQGKYAEARAAYDKVKASELANKDRDARARAIEGVGLAYEAQGQLEPAVRAFRELENTDIPGIGALGLYHQARLLVKQGKREEAKAPLKKALDKLSKAEGKGTGAETTPPPAGAPGFLESQLRELLSSVDPTAVPKAAPGLTPEQLQRLQTQLGGKGTGKIDAKQLEEMLKQMTTPASPGGPAAPAPAPDEGAPVPAAPAPEGAP